MAKAKTMTLVTKRLYFGVDAMRLRDASERVLLRVHGLPPERARVGADALAQDFGWSEEARATMLDQMVQDGMLAHLGGREFFITDKFRQCATARIVEALPRSKAQMLIAHIADLAAHFNRKASRNKYEISAIAVYGGYMSSDRNLSKLSLAITGRRRAVVERALFGRATKPTEGRDQIRTLLESQSSFVEVAFYRRLPDVPRPFSVVFEGDER